jgi:hypothetical protein
MPKTSFTGPFIGLNTRKEASKLLAGEAEFCENINLDRGTGKTRPGYTEVENISGLPLGAFDFHKSDGTVIQLAKIGDTMYGGSGWSLSALTNGSGLSATNRAEFVGFNNRVYFADGASGLKVTDGSSVFTAQIARPSTAPTVAAVAATTKFKGDYDYKYSYYSTTWGQESPASDASSVLSVSNATGQVDIDDWDLTTQAADSRIDKFRLYRREVSSNETLWRWIKDIDIPATTGTTVRDSALDNDISRTVIAPLSVDDPTPADIAYITVQSGVMLACAENSNTVYYSLASRPWVMVNSTPIGSDADSDPVTALFSFGGLAYAGKRQSLWVISGNTEDTIGSSLISNEGGIYASGSVIHGKKNVYWWGENKAWVFDGDKPVEISDPVEPEIAGRLYSRDSFIVGAYDYDCNAVVWSYTPSDQTTNTKQLAYFERNSEMVGQPSWSFWDLGTISTLLRYTDSTTKDRHFLWATSAGSFRKAVEGSKDNTTEVQIRWRTGKVDFGLPVHAKVVHDVTVEGAHSSAIARMSVRYRIDNNDNAYESGEFWDPKARAVRKIDLSRRARDFRLEVYSTVGIVEVTGWEFTVDGGSRR